MTIPLWTDSDWTEDLLQQVTEEIYKIAIPEMGLDPYPIELNIIHFEQMLDAYSSIGMPIFYKHWSFGKSFTRNKTLYDHGMQGLAYEIVINSDPCIAYLMENNTMTMMALVIGHASFGHSHFFKNNSTFKYWTDATSIMDYLVFAKEYVAKCEEREGNGQVERFLDSCHALMNYGINRYKRPSKLSVKREKDRQEGRDEFARIRVNDLFDRLLKTVEKNKEEVFPPEPEENILYFCEKYAPDLHVWQRELIRIVRKLSEYFHPQSLTRTMNEGCLVEGSLIDTIDGMIPIEELVRSKLVTGVWDGENWRDTYDWFKLEPKLRIKVVTHHGYEIHGGADHKLLINGEWKTLADLQVGDELPIGFQNEVFARDYADLPPMKYEMHLTNQQISETTGISPGYYRSVMTGRHSCSDDRKLMLGLHDQLFHEHVEGRFDRGTETVTQNPVQLNEDFAYWLGVLIGDGSMSEQHRYVTIVNADDEILQKWATIGRSLFGLTPIVKPEEGKTRIFFYSFTLLRWLRDHLDIKVGYAADRKHIPVLILRSPRSVVRAFLQGLFDADGCAPRIQGGSVVYISKSQQLAKQVQQVILRFGVISRVTLQADTCYRLTVTGIDAEVFATNVGFGLTRKQSLLREMIGLVKYRMQRNVTTKVVTKEEDFGPTFDFSVEDTHQYTSGAFIHHNCATYTHYRIMNRLHEKGLMTDGSMYEFLKSHTNVVFQPDYDDPRYSGINPYALGFAMMRDIERICKEPTPEDRKWFPQIAGCNDELDVLKDAWANYRDESFIRQYLSPKLIRNFKLFRVKDSAKEPNLLVTAIHNDTGYEKIRESLADQYETHNHSPQLEIVRVDPKTRHLNIVYKPYRGRVLANVPIMLKHLETLWGYPVLLKDDKGNELK